MGAAGQSVTGDLGGGGSERRDDAVPQGCMAVPLGRAGNEMRQVTPSSGFVSWTLIP